MRWRTYLAPLRDGVLEARPREGEFLAVVEEEVAHILLEVRLENASVHVVGDPASVHSVSDEVLERAPGKELVVVLEGLLEIEREQLAGDVEVRVVKVIAPISADLAVLSPL